MHIFCLSSSPALWAAPSCPACLRTYLSGSGNACQHVPHIMAMACNAYSATYGPERAVDGSVTKVEQGALAYQVDPAQWDWAAIQFTLDRT